MSEDSLQSLTTTEWSDKQLKAIGLLADIDKSKNFDDIAKTVDVSRMTLYVWRQEPGFIEAVKKIRDKNTKWKVTPVINKLFAMALDGDIQAIKMALQLTGEVANGDKGTNVNLFVPVREYTPKEIEAYNKEFDEEC